MLGKHIVSTNWNMKKSYSKVWKYCKGCCKKEMSNMPHGNQHASLKVISDQYACQTNTKWPDSNCQELLRHELNTWHPRKWIEDNGKSGPFSSEITIHFDVKIIGLHFVLNFIWDKSLFFNLSSILNLNCTEYTKRNKWFH